MSNAALSIRSEPPASTGTKQVVAGVLAAWLALVLFLAAQGIFVQPPGTPPLPILIGALLPIVAFLAALRASPSFRALVIALDLRIVVAIQAWRFAGLGFLALYTYGFLPGFFAWPAGLGDIAIGVTAPWVAWALIRKPEFAAGNAFIGWNLFGMLDLVVAVGTGVLSAILGSGAAGEVTISPMAELPLVLIPGYLVPLFIMLHIVALLQARRLKPIQ